MCRLSLCVRLLALALQLFGSLCHLLWSLYVVTHMQRVQVIKKHKNSHQQYVDRLLAEGTLTEDEVSVVHNRIQRILQEEFDLAKDYKPKENDWLSSVWVGFKTPAQRSRIRNTGLPCAVAIAFRFWPLKLLFSCVWSQQTGCALAMPCALVVVAARVPTLRPASSALGASMPCRMYQPQLAACTSNGHLLGECRR